MVPIRIAVIFGVVLCTNATFFEGDSDESYDDDRESTNNEEFSEEYSELEGEDENKGSAEHIGGEGFGGGQQRSLHRQKIKIKLVKNESLLNLVGQQVQEQHSLDVGSPFESMMVPLGKKVKSKLRRHKHRHHKHQHQQHQTGEDFESVPVVDGAQQSGKLVVAPPLLSSLLDKVLKPVRNTSKEAEDLENPEKLNEPTIPAVCYFWPQGNVRTFDNKVFSYKSGALLKLIESSSFVVDVQVDHSLCIQSSTPTQNCIQVTTIILVNDKEYVIKHDVNGTFKVYTAETEHPVPCKFDGFEAKKLSANAFVVNTNEDTLSIQGTNKGIIKVTVQRLNVKPVSGLCGNLDGNPENDVTAADVKSFVKKCEEGRIFSFIKKWKNILFSEGRITATDFSEAAIKDSFCYALKQNPKFAECRKKMGPNVVEAYFEACMGDYLSCPLENKQDCGCTTIEVLTEICGRMNAPVEKWRQSNFCPLECGGRLYSSCAPAHQPTCRDALVLPTIPEALGDECQEGCICPSGTFLHNGSCIAADKCPCLRMGKEYNSGDTFTENCNTCTCQAGEWHCTSKVCSAECSGFGSFHFRTFDRSHITYNGFCSYTLMKTENVSVYSICDKKFGNSPVQPSTCARHILIEMPENRIELREKKNVVVDNLFQDNLPINVKNLATIRIASSMFIQVRLWNSVEVNWDGHSLFSIYVPGRLQNQTKGLCGTFNFNQKDDFLTPENDIESGVNLFFQKWAVPGSCVRDVDSEASSQVCSAEKNRRDVAIGACQIIKSETFAECHKVVDPALYYEDCLTEACGCAGKHKASCFCPAIAAYAQECANQNVSISWRSTMKECGVQCDFGLEYKECADSCRMTCQDLSTQSHCKSHCIPGCQCPEGKFLDSEGNCVLLESCPCRHQGLEYKAGEVVFKDKEKCQCQHAQWVCSSELDVDLLAVNQTTLCNGDVHQEFVHCLPSKMLTCQNMIDHTPSLPSVCHNGCVCKPGYVLDAINGLCVKPTDCPCHHGGHGYTNGESIRTDCNSCTCANGLWNCTTKECPGICSSWGDSHFKTFDSQIYDFQGACDYVLAKGQKENDTESFTIINELVPCGSTGITCSKAVIIMSNIGATANKIILSKNKATFSESNHAEISTHETELYVIVTLIRHGVTLRWDRGTRVAIQVDPRWRGSVSGLCGNFNGDGSDDFQTPSGLVETSPQTFGNSWKIQSFCTDIEETVDLTSACSENPHRIRWVTEKCSVLKSAKFAACHSEVVVEPFYKRCLFDACACDEGGDCECLCTVISEYAQQCNTRGVHINWRSQRLCPLQCSNSSSYEPCVSPCPPVTCQSLHKPASTCTDTCIEGCRLNDCHACPEGEVFYSSDNTTCVPISHCPCLVSDDITYHEGDEVPTMSDECRRCFCSRGSVVCTSRPCKSLDLFTSPATTETPTTTAMSPQLGGRCEEGQVYLECKIRCGQLCGKQLHEAKKSGLCGDSEDDCIGGCWPKSLSDCPEGYLWEGVGRCSPARECVCVTANGAYLKPGEVEILGEKICQCFNNKYECTTIPSTTVEVTRSPEIPAIPKKSYCTPCPGVDPNPSCACRANERWNGTNCVSKLLCPCVVGPHVYDVGKVFFDDTCQKCLCLLGGDLQCSPLSCSCDSDLVPATTPSCRCLCQPCPSGTRFCLREGINKCISESKWCDGRTDCDDSRDEISCTKAPIVKEKECPTITCPPGYKPRTIVKRIKRFNYAARRRTQEEQENEQYGESQSMEQSHSMEQSQSMDQSQSIQLTQSVQTSSWVTTETHIEVDISFWGSAFSKNQALSKHFKNIKNKNSKQKQGHKRPKYPANQKKEEPVCPEFECAPDSDTSVECISPPACPRGYELENLASRESICPMYKCKTKPIPDTKCEVTDKTISTFDHTHYKADICNHILARDKESNLWNLTMFQTCSIRDGCSKMLSLMHLGRKIEFYSNMSYTYDDRMYSSHLMEKIGRKTGEFEFKTVGFNIMLISVLEFSVTWDKHAHVKIYLPASYAKRVDGLCGLFNDNPADDLSMPHGSLAETVEEFLTSWGNSSSCQMPVCSSAVLDQASGYCSILRNEHFKESCANLGTDKLEISCIESICSCMEMSRSIEECRCAALERIMLECETSTNSIQVGNWRATYNCPGKCEAPQVYQDCFNKICETTCDNILIPGACPVLPDLCLPGCYCPEGYVRENDRCVQQSDCRNCICSGHGSTRIVTFDKLEYDFQSDCTYILVETIPTFPGNFTILFSDRACTSATDDQCSATFTIKTNENSVTIERFKSGGKEVTVTENGGSSNFIWSKVNEDPQQSVTVSIPSLNVDLTVFIPQFGFKIGLPSPNYFGKTRGLCGVCNYNQTDDMLKTDETITDDVTDFVTNWLAADNGLCVPKNKSENIVQCVIPDPNPCALFDDISIFGSCFSLVDPGSYKQQCEYSFCHQRSICFDFEEYAEDCLAVGVCVNWRGSDHCPYQCLPGLEYHACSTGGLKTCERNENEFNEIVQDLCVCPDNLVFNNGTCIDKRRCQPCDDKGHFFGDEWSPNNCVKCACTADGVECLNTVCPKTTQVCSFGYKSVVDSRTESECCPEYICTPDPEVNTTCETPVIPTCSDDQVLKQLTTTGNCIEYYCTCKAPEECPQVVLAETSELIPGMVEIIKQEGCCNKSALVCKPETCPDIQFPCSPFHERVKSAEPELCCPKFECKLPKNTCLYEMEWEFHPQGGERPIDKKETVLKAVGETWYDGPCRLCSCREGHNTSQCTLHKCKKPDQNDDYIYEKVSVPQQCCPKYERVACKPEDKIYRSGETWRSSDDVCKTHTCSLDDSGVLVITTKEMECQTNCAFGWRYEPSTNHAECCGVCKPRNCVWENQEYSVGSMWATDNNCTVHSCSGDFQVVTSVTQCPDTSDCPKDQLLDQGCCKECIWRPESQQNCVVEKTEKPVEAYKLYNLVHGNCWNDEILSTLTRCGGNCNSGTEYDATLDKHLSQCQCCKPTRFVPVELDLACETGTRLRKSVLVPAACSCKVTQCQDLDKEIIF